MDNNNMKMCSTALVIKKIQIKTIMNYHFIPLLPQITTFNIRTANVKNTVTSNKEVELLKLSYIAFGNIRWCHYFRKLFSSFLASYIIELKVRLNFDSAIPFLSNCPKEIKTYVHEKVLYKNVYCSFIHDSSKLERTPVSSTQEWIHCGIVI